MSTFDVKYESERRPHAYLSNCAYCMLEFAKTTEYGKTHYLWSSLLFSAFSIESYLNYLGEKYISFWPEIDTIATVKKIKVACKYKNLEVNWGQRPFQTIIDLFSFRNKIVHAKPIVLTGKETLQEEDFGCFEVIDSWEKYPTITNASRAKSDTIAIMEILKNAYNDDSNILFPGSSSFESE